MSVPALYDNIPSLPVSFSTVEITDSSGQVVFVVGYVLFSLATTDQGARSDEEFS